LLDVLLDNVAMFTTPHMAAQLTARLGHARVLAGAQFTASDTLWRVLRTLWLDSFAAPLAAPATLSSRCDDVESAICGACIAPRDLVHDLDSASLASMCIDSARTRLLRRLLCGGGGAGAAVRSAVCSTTFLPPLAYDMCNELDRDELAGLAGAQAQASASPLYDVNHDRIVRGDASTAVEEVNGSPSAVAEVRFGRRQATHNVDLKNALFTAEADGSFKVQIVGERGAASVAHVAAVAAIALYHVVREQPLELRFVGVVRRRGAVQNAAAQVYRYATGVGARAPSLGTGPFVGIVLHDEIALALQQPNDTLPRWRTRTHRGADAAAILASAVRASSRLNATVIKSKSSMLCRTTTIAMPREVFNGGDGRSDARRLAVHDLLRHMTFAVRDFVHYRALALCAALSAATNEQQRIGMLAPANELSASMFIDSAEMAAWRATHAAGMPDYNGNELAKSLWRFEFGTWCAIAPHL